MNSYKCYQEMNNPLLLSNPSLKMLKLLHFTSHWAHLLLNKSVSISMMHRLLLLLSVVCLLKTSYLSLAAILFVTAIHAAFRIFQIAHLHIKVGVRNLQLAFNSRILLRFHQINRLIRLAKQHQDLDNQYSSILLTIAIWIDNLVGYHRAFPLSKMITSIKKMQFKKTFSYLKWVLTHILPIIMP